MLRSAARWVWERPGVQLVTGAAVLAIAFPASAAGSLALAIIAGALGVAIARWWPHAPMRLRQPGRLGCAFVLVLVPVVGLTVFWETVTTSPDWLTGDWGPQHAVLARIVPSLPGLDVPTWNHALSTGDAPLELYPAFTYLFTGHLAVLLGLEHDLPLVYMIVGTGVHLALATLTTALALRVASRKAALVVGLFWLIEGGAISHGGTVGLFRWAILHSAFAHVFSMAAALGIVAALRRPRLASSLTIWLGTAIATAAHPSALLTAAACALGLVGVALLATDVPPRRAFAALGHLAIGVALGALVWLPASDRLLLYGQHFANELYTAASFLQLVMTYAMPITVFSLIVYAGYFGMVAAVFSRRADIVFVAIVAFALLLGVVDTPYLGFGLMPGDESGRLGAVRMMLLVRPFIFVAAAYTFTLLGARIADTWRGAPHRQRMIAAALVGVCCGVLLRVFPAYWREETQRVYEETRNFAADADGRKALEQWAHVQAANLGPRTWARALFEQTTHEQMHLTARTGLPVLHMGPLPDLLLRERIENTQEASLARFNVRWIVGVGKSPKLGDPNTEQQLGSFFIRELPAWDGKFARIERGQGEVVVHRLDDRAVEIEVTGTREPVLVALGTGFYPRWRARHASGASQPVYALPAFEGAQLHVVSAWVAPGRTTFTVDGPLPSDGKGRWLALPALLVALAGVVVWSRARWRIRVLRELARLRPGTRGAGRWLVRIAAPLVVVVLAIRGCTDVVSPAKAFVVGTGIRGAATVEARIANGDWTECGYSRLRGEYDCEGLVIVTDATANLVNDAPPSWPFITPAVLVSAYDANVEVRITRELRLAGTYWAGSSSEATLYIDNDAGRDVGKTKEVVDVRDGKHRVRFEAAVPYPGGLKLTFVAANALDPPRPFLAPPPAEAPAAVRAIR